MTVGQAQNNSVCYLPPIRLSFTLSENYPLDAPPTVSLKAQGSWLPEDIAEHQEAVLASMWEEYGHNQMLFASISHVQDAAESAFGLDYLEVSEECKR